MKKTFEIPTIEKIDFRLSDASMCADVATNHISGVVGDSGVIENMQGSQLESMLGQ